MVIVVDLFVGMISLDGIGSGSIEAKLDGLVWFYSR